MDFKTFNGKNMEISCTATVRHTGGKEADHFFLGSESEALVSYYSKSLVISAETQITPGFGLDGDGEDLQKVTWSLDSTYLEKGVDLKIDGIGDVFIRVS